MIEWFETVETPPEINIKLNKPEQLLISDGEYYGTAWLIKESGAKIVPIKGMEIKPKFWARVNLPEKNKIDEQLDSNFNIFLEWNPTGECKVDLSVIEQLWNSDWFISRYREKFTLVHVLEGEKQIKALISKDQANAIIEMFNLTEEPNTVFDNASAWR